MSRIIIFFSGRNARFKEKIKKKEKAVSGIQKSRLSWVLETALEIVVSVVGFFCIVHYSECDTVIKI